MRPHAGDEGGQCSDAGAPASGPAVILEAEPPAGSSCTGGACSQDEAAISKLSGKVVQLTKAIAFLYTYGDSSDARSARLRSELEEEVRHVAGAASRRVEAQQKHVSFAASRRARRLDAYRQQQAECRENAEQGLSELRATLADREKVERANVIDAESERATLLAEVHRRAAQVKTELAVGQDRMRHDERWLLRHLAAEAAKQRQSMDAEFEAACARLREEHAAELVCLRQQREASVASARAEHSERHACATSQIQEDALAAISQHEESFRSEQGLLERRTEAAKEHLAEARAASTCAKDENAIRQHLLDEMARDLQENTRRAHTLASEADLMHERRLRAEADTRDFRKQKLSIERALGGAAGAPHTERALAGLAEDVRKAQGRLGALRSELARLHRLVEERRAAVGETSSRAARLSNELAEERRRADELRRVLLRSEHCR